jgi:hypothetical protein
LVKERKKQEKEEMRENMKMLKDIKKNMIEEKLSRLQQISGLTEEDDKQKLQQLINGQFEGKEFDRQMGEIFGEEYFDQEEENERKMKKYVEHDLIVVQEDFPKRLKFKKREAKLLQIKTKGLYFPAHIAIDKVGVEFFYYITFDGRYPSERDYDCYYQGDFILVKFPYATGCDFMHVLMKARKKSEVMFCISFTSKIFFSSGKNLLTKIFR